jgi:hypothetical protein
MGTIGVQCSFWKCNLWFFLEKVAFAEEGAARIPLTPDNEDDTAKHLVEQMKIRRKLTSTGVRIAQRILKIDGVWRLWARPTYFDLDIKDDKLWPDILPQVIRIIREETKDPQAKVAVLRNPAAPDVPQWHAPLLQKLFG